MQLYKVSTLSHKFVALWLVVETVSRREISRRDKWTNCFTVLLSYSRGDLVSQAGARFESYLLAFVASDSLIRIVPLKRAIALVIRHLR